MEIEEQYFCIICEQTMAASSEEARCSFCGQNEKADYVCPAGHYVCEACRLASAVDLIRKTCEVSNEPDPVRIAILLMKHPAIPIHGSENHLVTACSLLTALRNSGRFPVGRREFNKAFQRLRKASHGICASWGVCGCAIAAGAVFSIITGATYRSDKERSSAMRVAAKVLNEIARFGGPRCCKMATCLSLRVAVEFLQDELSVSIPAGDDPKPCVFSKSNPECLKARCPFYGET